jgi:cellulose synthase/poly-beta-1,6-N-acetylglucosamine synthase-like glycosyltransferase
MRRELIERVGGWDEECLTEDADIGLRLSELGEPIQVVYDAEYVTREEAPNTAEQFVKQRTRWHQGFLQVLRKGTWRKLPSYRQRLLAAYVLTYPLFQAAMTLMLPVSVASVFVLRVPLLVAMISLLPLYALMLQLGVTLVGTVLFAREYRLSMPFLALLILPFACFPYQLLIGFSAVRAVSRELRRQTNWEKTVHIGAHRPAAVPAQVVDLELPELVAA